MRHCRHLFAFIGTGGNPPGIMFGITMDTTLTGFMIPLSIVVAMVALLAGLNWWKSLLAGGITGAIIYYLFTILLRVPL